MKPAIIEREVHTGGVQAKASFGISLRNQAHIMHILRDTLYTDKILAVLREYASNAWDAHRMVGKGDVPIKIVLPTHMEPTLVIRDFGPGLSEEDIFRIYTQYGESTKRDSNEAVGMLGIGSKSGFAYSDSFTITSFNGGMKQVYVAVLDASDVGEINKMHEESCGDETGLEIKIPVQPSDIWLFENRARSLFSHFHPLPDINLAHFEAPKYKHSNEHGFMLEGERSWTAIMGCVPYRINLEQVRHALMQEGIWEALSQMIGGGLYFNIGDVHINASREELKYSEATKKAIVDRMKALVETYVESVLTVLDDPTILPWDKRLKAAYISQTLRFPIPSRYREFSRRAVSLFKEPQDGQPPDEEKSFTLRVFGNGPANTAEVTKVTVGSSTRIIIKDDSRNLQGFGGSLSGNDIILRPAVGVTVEKARLAIEKRLADAGCTGLPLHLLSEFEWQERSHVNGRQWNPKHLVRNFRLKAGAVRRSDISFSENWEACEWEPSDEDVYVLIKHFRVDGKTDFYDTYITDERMANRVGITMPPVYGYKTTEKHPVDPATLKGREYHTWRTTFFRDNLTPKLREMLIDWGWSLMLADDFDYRVRSLGEHVPKLIRRLKADLGTSHPLTVVFERHHQALQVTKTLPDDILKALPHLFGLTSEATEASQAKDALRNLFKVYPLFGVIDDGLGVLLGRHADKWFDYIRLVDTQSETDSQEAVA